MLMRPVGVQSDLHLCCLQLCIMLKADLLTTQLTTEIISLFLDVSLK